MTEKINIPASTEEISPSEYLDDHLARYTDPSVPLVDLYKSLVGVDIESLTGEVEMIVDNNKISYTYGQLSKDKFSPESIEQNRKLQSATITNLSTGEVCDLIPSEYLVTFRTKTGIPKNETIAYAYDDAKLIGLNFVPDNVGMVLALFHERGHANDTDPENRKDRAHDAFGGNVLTRKEPYWARMLKSEESAMDALRKDLEPFVSDNPEAQLSRENVENYIYGGLKVYADKIGQLREERRALRSRSLGRKVAGWLSKA